MPTDTDSNSQSSLPACAAADVELSSVRCSAATKHRVKVYAVLERTTITAVVEAALQEYLERHPHLGHAHRALETQIGR